MSLKQYLLKVEKSYKFRIKALFPLDDDDCMALLEKALQQVSPDCPSRLPRRPSSRPIRSASLA
jgi:hypothetical protein